MKHEEKREGLWRRLVGYFFATVVLLIFFGAALGPVTGPYGGGHFSAVRNASMMTAREIGQSLIQYSKDHQGHFPEGKTSTEVFQQLMDQGYVTDPDLFYRPFPIIPGKVQPGSTRLGPQNVCFDVSVPVDALSSDKLPLVFLTGYKVTYEAGAAAMPLFQIKIPSRTWTQWLNGVPVQRPFISVFYKDGSTYAISAGSDGTIPNFIPADFDPKGKTYRQVTP